ncbi:hypothetical protein QEJ31_01060 [Pigmentibacter sp. JX0631]|uniref:TadE/TadG family type IV pilus assembly protein n=1 Tax=Pigmentibacter sp. JX0631 TaxID=2976982 RepID=UPI002469124A|nr:hypothetical protein [Pigmentibacter sp. JX0631]WGL60192.1 hypothetical protein QEJ31_01060 [Pigmentibacter sp. JX0631]
MKLFTKNSDGLTLLEFVFIFPTIIFLAISIVEISRLYSFKLFLQAITNDISIYLSHQKLKINISSDSEIDDIKNEIKKNIVIKIDNFPTYKIQSNYEKIGKYSNSIYLDIVFIDSIKEKIPSGIYLKINTCLPLLFSKFLNEYFYKEISIGKKSENNSNKNRNCLGHFLTYETKESVFYFRVRSAAYIPWPASTNIFLKGLYIPDKFYGMETINETEKRNFFMQNIGKNLEQ